MALDVVLPSSVHERPPSKGRRQCSCCPYGYHIDLDFVRYCESITNAQLMPSASVRRSRWNNVRRKRASREALLGLDIKPEPKVFESHHVKIPADIGDDLQRAVLDFEKTLKHASLPRCIGKKDRNGFESLERSAINRGNHVPSKQPPTSLTLPRMASRSAKDGISQVLPIEEMLFANSNNNIREQMAASLRRMKELEERIRVIPQLHDQIGNLRKENETLRNDLNSKQTQLSKLSSIAKSDKICSTQDLVHSRAAGVGCTVLTREIGISPSRIQNRTVAVETDREKSIDDHIGSVVSLNNIIGSPRLPPKTSDASVMTDANFTATEKKPVPKERVERRSKGVSTDVGMHDFVTVKEMSKKLKEIQIECAPPPKPHKVSIRVNTHLVHDQIFTQDELDEQVSRFAKTYESNFLSTNLAKKANLISVGVQVANKLEKKHIGLQTATKVHDIGVLAKPNCSVASLQVSPVTKSVGVSNHTTSLDPCERCHVKKTSIGTLFPDRSELLLQRIRSSPEMTVAKRKTISRSTDTRELINTKDVSLNTGQKKLVSTAVVTGDYSCNRCSSSHETKAPPLTSRPSGIPTPAKRPSYLPISVHRVKTPTSPSPQHNTLQHEGSNSDSGSDDGTYTIHQDVDSRSKPDTFLERSSISPQDYVRREPSMEMRGAMKVLNDTLQKSSGGDIPKHVKTAVNIVQQEWFKVSSTASANPLDVEYYLDCFEEISGTLLEYVVNMADVSGNTAMHYAVSNGNFDVVSILLDSKVCNINKLNTAGYTCIMLVALTKVKSETDREVVRRLFHLADVNIRAKEHGQTALMLAVSHGRLDTVELLLEAGADINIQDEDGSTALMCAAEHGYIEIVKLLLAQPDCDLSLTDYDGTTALAIAMEAGNRDIGVLLYAQEHFSRGSSPYTSLKHKRSKSTTPTLKSSRPTTPSHSSHKKDFESES